MYVTDQRKTERSVFMRSLSYSHLRPAAEEALELSCFSPKRLVLLHTGVSLIVGLIISILTYVLDMGIAQTGGLSGMDSRAMLQSMQYFLTIASTILLPFWEVGYLFAALQFARRKHPQTGALFAGFRHWGVVLRGMILQGILLFAVVFVGAQIVSTIYFMTPASAELQALTLELAENGADSLTMMENEQYFALILKAMPFLLIGVGLLLLPTLYLLRFTNYVIMDHPEMGARYAVATSIRMTWRNFGAIFKLDLRFVWYYLLEVLVAVIGIGYVILELMGVDIGIGGDTAVFVFYLLSLAAQLGLYVWMKNIVSTTYALAYDELFRSVMPPALKELPPM